MGRELVLLVLHQGDERADDDGQPGQEQRGQLIDDRFSASRRHHDEGVVSSEHGSDRLPLTGAKIGMAKALVEDSASAGLGDDLGHGRQPDEPGA